MLLFQPGLIGPNGKMTCHFKGLFGGSKPPPPQRTPPPVRESNTEAVSKSELERKKASMRKGYAATESKGSLLGSSESTTGGKSLLG